MLIISHDRYFINKLADRIFHIECGTIRKYDGNYDFFLTHCEQDTAPKEQTKKKTDKKDNDYFRQKEFASEQRKLKSIINKNEKRISELEQAIEELRNAVLQPELASDYERVLALTKQISDAEKELEDCYEQWETASQKLEDMI